MLKFLCLSFVCCFAYTLHAQQTLLPRVAVYNTDGERYVADSAEFLDSVVVLHIGDLAFEIAEERFARLEPIPGATFSDPAQIYSFSLKTGEVIVGQVNYYRKGVVSVRISDEKSTTILRDEIQTLHREKRSIFEKPYVKRCANTNFISSPYALNRGEVVFSSNVYANTVEVGLGNGFQAKGLSSVLPFILPTGYEFSYRKRLPGSHFSVGLSAGQIWLDPTGELNVSETINSTRQFINVLSPSFTYHMGDSYVKTGITMLSGSALFTNTGTIFATTTFSAPGIKKPRNRWNATANFSFSDERRNSGFRSLFLLGHQFHAPKASYTLGLSFFRGRDVAIIPAPYVYFSLYSSKEQRKVAKAFDTHRRMKLLKRSIDLSNARLKRDRERRAYREARRIERARN